MSKCTLHPHDISLFSIAKEHGRVLFKCQGCIGDDNADILYEINKEREKLIEIQKIIYSLTSRSQPSLFDFYPLSKDNIEKTLAQIDSWLAIFDGRFEELPSRQLYFGLKPKLRGPKYIPLQK